MNETNPMAEMRMRRANTCCELNLDYLAENDSIVYLCAVKVRPQLLGPKGKADDIRIDIQLIESEGRVLLSIGIVDKKKKSSEIIAFS